MKLTEDEVIQILKLMEESRFDELRLETGDLKLHIRKGGVTLARGEEGFAVFPQPEIFPKPATEVKRAISQNRVEEPEKTEKGAERVPEERRLTSEEGLSPIKSPMLGTFYRRPSPGAPPYVEVGTFVKEEDTVCLLEVMKVFNSVKAGLRGYVEKVCVETGDLVEYGQVLFLVRPANAAEGKT